MPEERFLTLEVVQRELFLSNDEVVQLIRDGELAAIHLLGTWRVERVVLEQFISYLYACNTLTSKYGVDIEQKHEIPQTNSADKSHELGNENSIVPSLTPQMRRVLELVGRGLSNAEIATELTLEVSTVKSHVSRLLSRLGVRNREGLVAFAWSSGWMHRKE